VRFYAPPLLSILISAACTLVPEQADAETGLFSIRRTFHSDQVGQGNRTRTASFPTASGYVGTTSVPRFTVPQSAIKDTTGYGNCIPGTCRTGYPWSKAWYSYWNLRGSFRPNNPYGATTTTTVRFPTTMGNTGPPIATGEPVTPTTTFDGRYDFRRHGSIMLTPGPNRFGGTMQFFYGPNHHYYQFTSVITVPCCRKAYGGGQPPVSTNHESNVGEFVVGRQMDRFLMTPGQQYRATDGAGNFLVSNVQYVSTIAPFTTGMITGYQPFGRTTTVHTLTGYDNRTTTSMGKLSGVISLVRPRLVHTYLKEVDPNAPIGMTWATASSWQIDFQFLPEPRAVAMLATGFAALACLCRSRRR
jgi:hypothetical protein